MQQLPKTLINGLSAAATQTSEALYTRSLTKICAIATIAGATALSAAVTIEGSNDVSDGSSGWTPTNWAPLKDITGTDISITASVENGSKSSVPADICVLWVRVKFTYTSGTGGTVTVKVHLQGPAA